MKCISCQHEIDDNTSSCPFCHATYTPEKWRFIKYLGEPGSLIGYQRSYKLVLLKVLFEFILDNKVLSVDEIMMAIKAYYLQRIKKGLSADYDVDERIQNLTENTSLYDIWAVFKVNPYKVINEQSFLFLEKNKSNELVFVLSEGITNNTSANEYQILLDLVTNKLSLYYSKHDIELNHSIETIEKKEGTLILDETTKDLDSILIINTELSVRAKHCLIRKGILTIKSLLNLSEDDLHAIRNLGAKTIEEIKVFCSKYHNEGLSVCGAYESTQQITPLTKLQSTELSVRAKNSLMRYGYNLIGDLLNLTEIELYSIPNIGEKTVQEILSYIIGIKKELSKTDDKYNKYPFGHINTECELINASILHVFGVPKLIIRKLLSVGIHTLGQLKGATDSQLHDKLGTDFSKLIQYPLYVFSDGIIRVTEQLLCKLQQKNDLSFIVDYSRGMTLQEIGDKNGFTREYARQKIEKPMVYIRPVAVVLAKEIMKKSNQLYATIQDICDIYDNNDFDAILTYALSSSDEIEFIREIGIYLIKDDVSYVNRLDETLKEYVGDGVFWHERIQDLISILETNGLSFLDTDDIWLYMLNKGYKTYKDFVVTSRIPVGYLLEMVIAEDFPDGISQSNHNEIELLRCRATEKFGELSLPQEDRVLFARVNDYLVLRDRGRWISPKNIEVEISTIEIIKEYIDFSSDDIIYYQSLFNHFSGLLNLTSDINNYNYLHGVLRYYYRNNYIFYKDYLQKNKGYITGKLSDRITEYIKQLGRAASKDELKTHLNISSDSMIFNVVNNQSEIFQWDYNYYNCLDNICIYSDEKDLIIDMIDEIMSNHKNYCSAKLIFEYCNLLIPDMITRNNIINANNLFYLIGAIHSEKYKFRIPHILPAGSNLTSTEDIIRSFLDDYDSLDYTEFIELVDNYGWGHSTAIPIFDSICNEKFCRISRTQYIRKQSFKLDETIVTAIKEKLNDIMIDRWYIGNWEINFSTFPQILYEWNIYILNTIVRLLIDNIRVIAPAYGTKKEERSLYVLVESGVSTFEQLIVKVIKSSGHNRFSENEMYTLLALNGVIKNSVPNEIRNSMFIEYINGIYTLKESA